MKQRGPSAHGAPSPRARGDPWALKQRPLRLLTFRDTCSSGARGVSGDLSWSLLLVPGIWPCTDQPGSRGRRGAPPGLMSGQSVWFSCLFPTFSEVIGLFPNEGLWVPKKQSSPKPLPSSLGHWTPSPFVTKGGRAPLGVPGEGAAGGAGPCCVLGIGTSLKGPP